MTRGWLSFGMLGVRKMIKGWRMSELEDNVRVKKKSASEMLYTHSSVAMNSTTTCGHSPLIYRLTEDTRLVVHWILCRTLKLQMLTRYQVSELNFNYDLNKLY